MKGKGVGDFFCFVYLECEADFQSGEKKWGGTRESCMNNIHLKLRFEGGLSFRGLNALRGTMFVARQKVG